MTRASVSVEGSIVGDIGRGLLVLVGVGHADGAADVAWAVEKIAGLRIFDDELARMNLSVEDVGGSVLLVSQFTLHGDVRKGRRPAFSAAGAPELATKLYDAVSEGLRAKGLRVETGRFAARMAVELVNDGPVTILLDSERTF